MPNPEHIWFEESVTVLLLTTPTSDFWILNTYDLWFMILSAAPGQCPSVSQDVPSMWSIRAITCNIRPLWLLPPASHHHHFLIFHVGSGYQIRSQALQCYRYHLLSVFPKNNQTSAFVKVTHFKLPHEPQWTNSTLRKVLPNSGFASFYRSKMVVAFILLGCPSWAYVTFAFLISQRTAYSSSSTCLQTAITEQTADSNYSKFQGKRSGELPMWRTFYIGFQWYRGWSLGEGCLFARLQHSGILRRIFQPNGRLGWLGLLDSAVRHVMNLNWNIG